MRKGKTNKNNNGKGNRQQAKEKVSFITYYDGILVSELANRMGRSASELIKILFLEGISVNINSALDDDAVLLLCDKLNLDFDKEEKVEIDHLAEDEDGENVSLIERAPIVTIMGHVDHGKTTLLDYIRNSRVVEGEFGGITQHIGAYQVSVNEKLVTFLDTPGHEAFTAMRARGAGITDIAIIVVAADDGVMPQTKEAVDHAKAADVPIIVAVNKIDKPQANPEKIKQEMADLGLMCEEWGGDTIFVNCSAKSGEGVEELLETILVVAEVKELQANPKKGATGTVIEAKLDKGRGSVTTLLVQNGTLKQGDYVVVGSTSGRVRRMSDDQGRDIKKAGPSKPVEIIGLAEVPLAGDRFKVFENERDAKALADKLNREKIDKERKASASIKLDDMAARIDSGEIQEVAVLIKADVQGSAEAVAQSLAKIDVDGVKVNVIRSAAGGISESDIVLAKVSSAIIYGFNVRPSAQIRKKALEEGVDIRLHNIIYKVVEEMEAAMKGMLAPVYEEQVIGQAEVRKLYKVSKIGTIAGCMVTDGKLVRDCKCRLLRDGVVVYTGKLGSLKRFENDAKEVQSGYDCGLTLENFNDIKENDVVEAYMDVEVPVA